MPGNWHVSFLGGWAGVIAPGYPVGGSDVTSLPAQLPDECINAGLNDIKCMRRVHTLALHRDQQ